MRMRTRLEKYPPRKSLWFSSEAGGIFMLAVNRPSSLSITSHNDGLHRPLRSRSSARDSTIEGSRSDQNLVTPSSSGRSLARRSCICFY